MSDYNGWTNYATWRVNLEICGDLDPRDYWIGDNAYEFGKYLKSYAEDIIEHQTGNAESLAFSYAMAFLSDVNWTEIAQHMIDEYSDEEAA